MKQCILLLLGLVCGVSLFAQEKMYIHKSDHISLGALITKTDSVYFSSDGATAYFRIEGTLAQYQVSAIDSISFGANSSTISIVYNGTSAKVINPLAFEGISVAVSGADVTITSTTTTKDINYSLSGTTTDGMCKIYSDKRFNLLLNGVNITNANGPAINIQSNNKVSVTLVDGTTNTLADGTTYATAATTSTGTAEDQKAVFFSEGQLVFSGTGSLTIKGTGTDKHALCSDDYVEVDGGTVTVSSAVNDGIHGKEGVLVTGGTVKVTATGDGIDGDEGYIKISGGATTVTCATANVNAITCDSTLTVSGGTISVTVSGNQSKAFKSAQLITFSGGTTTINTSGAAVLETLNSGYNPAYCTAIKSDKNISVEGATITIVSSGAGGKGISAGGDFSMTSGTVNITTTGAGAIYKNSSGTTDAYNATCITADGNISILGGSVTTSSSGSGGKGIAGNGTLTFGDTSNSPTVNITTTGAKVSSGSTSYSEAKAMKGDGAVTLNNGTIIISSNDDGIKSEVSITINNNANVSITKSGEGMEAPYITVNSGTVSVVASDDSFNATKGNGGETNDGSCIYLNGGNVMLNSTTGDGLDSNGSIAMTGGTVVVHGPTSSPEVGMDYNGTFNISGGVLFATGPNSGNMIQATSTTSSQYCVKVLMSSTLSTSTLFHIQDSSGTDLATFKPVRSVYYVIFSSPNLKSGSTYSIYTGGTTTGTTSTGLYSGGTYSGGTLKKSFTVSSKVTSVSF